jgi:hypothetical protein
MFMQPFDSARPVFGIYRSAVSQFPVQHDACLSSGLTDEYPVACLVDFAEASVIQVGNSLQSNEFPAFHA